MRVKISGYTGYSGYKLSKTAWISQKTCNRFSNRSGYMWLQTRKIWQNQQNTDLKIVQGAVTNMNRSLQPSENALIQSAARGFASTVARRADTSRE